MPPTTEYVTWDELKDHCKDRKESCRGVAEANAKASSAGSEATLKSINEKLGAIPILVDRVATLEGVIGKPGTIVMQRYLLIVLVALAIGCGFAGRDAVSFLATLGTAKTTASQVAPQ